MTPLCFHLLPDATTADLDWAISVTRPGAWLKVCKPEQIAPAQAAGIKVYYRPYLNGDDNGTPSGKAWAESATTAINGAGGQWPHAIGYRNEMSCTQENVTEYANYRTQLRVAGFQGLVALGSFGVGNPDWPEYALLATVNPDAIEFHEYWDRTVAGSSRYWALRHVEAQARGLLSTETLLFIGECGADTIPTPGPVPAGQPKPLSIEDGVCRRGGWQSLSAYGCAGPKLTADEQSANIAAYSAGCAPNVVAAFAFADGGANPQWTAYHTWGTAVVDAIRATQQPPTPPTPQPPQPPVETGPTAPNLSKGTAMPVTPIDFRQLPGSLDCWVENIRRFYSRYGILLDEDTVFQAGKGYHRPTGGEAADFPTFRRAVENLARANGVQVGVDASQYQHGQNYLQLLEIDTFSTLWATLDDSNQANPWSVIIGENNGDLNPAEAWQHYMGLLQDPSGSDVINVYDPAATWDGDASQYTREQLQKAILDNWDVTIVGYALKIVAG